MKWFENNYLPKNIRKRYKNDWKISPAKSSSLANLPPAYIALAECDPLYDEGIFYSELLKNSGNDLDIDIFKGQIHGFLTMDSMIKDASLLIEKIKKIALEKLSNI